MFSGVLGLALCVSLFENIYQGLTRKRQCENAPQIITTDLRFQAQPRQELEARLTTSESTHPREWLGTCQQATVQLEAALKRARTEADACKSPKEKFDKGAPNPDAEKRVRAELDRVLANDAGLAWAVQCHAETCRVTIVSASGDQDWARNLQADGPLRRILSKTMFGERTATGDALTGQELTENEVYLELADDPTVRGRDLLVKVMTAFKESGATQECAKGQSVRQGALILDLQIEDGRFSIQENGSLVGSPTASCVEDRLRGIAAAFPIEADMTGNIRFGL